MPMLIWNAGGAPPSGPGTAARVDAATWFQWTTAVASAAAGGAADAPVAPSIADARSAAARRLSDRRVFMTDLPMEVSVDGPSISPVSAAQRRGAGGARTALDYRSRSGTRLSV